jgi:hypothetical protein
LGICRTIRSSKSAKQGERIKIRLPPVGYANESH